MAENRNIATGIPAKRESDAKKRMKKQFLQMPTPPQVKKRRKKFGGSQKCSTFASLKAQEHSSVGLERFSHIEEVIGSSPIVPTKRGSPSDCLAYYFPTTAQRYALPQRPDIHL